jgi:hypothetical protein
MHWCICLLLQGRVWFSTSPQLGPGNAVLVRSNVSVYCLPCMARSLKLLRVRPARSGRIGRFQWVRPERAHKGASERTWWALAMGGDASWVNRCCTWCVLLPHLIPSNLHNNASIWYKLYTKKMHINIVISFRRPVHSLVNCKYSISCSWLCMWSFLLILLNFLTLSLLIYTRCFDSR